MFLKSIRSFLLLSFVIGLAFSAGCSTLSVSVDKAAPKMQKDANIAYFKNAFSDRDYPILKDIIDATLYKNKSNESIDKFKEIEKIAGEQIASFCAQNIKQRTGNEVIIMDSSLQVNDYDVMDNITPQIEAKIAAECQKVNASYAFIPIMRVTATKVATWGVSGKNFFESKVYVCNKEGRIIGRGYISTEESDWITTIDTTLYHILIKSSEPLYKQLINDLFR